MPTTIFRLAALAALIACALTGTATADTLAGIIAGGDNLTAGRESWRNESAFIEYGDVRAGLGVDFPVKWTS